MGNFSGGSRGHNFRDRRGARSGGYRGDRGNYAPQMHSAICSECNNSCEVPFKPTGDKPVYCDGCFSNKRSNNDRDRRDGFRPRESRRDFGSRPAKQFPDMQTKASDDSKKLLLEVIEKLNHLTSLFESSLKVQPAANKIKAEVKPKIKKVANKKVASKKKKKFSPKHQVRLGVL